MTSPTEFAKTLRLFMKRADISLGKLSTRSGIPKPTIVNWVMSRVRRPQDWRQLVKIASALNLSQKDANRLLHSANHPAVEELMGGVSDEKDLKLFQPWMVEIRQRQQAPFPPIDNPRHFVGRQDQLNIIKNQLLNGRHVTIYGPPGVGKSTIAAHLTYLLRHQFPDGILWARLDTSNSTAILRSFANAYQLDIGQNVDLTSLSNSVRGFLAKKRSLIVLDNAQKDEELEPILPPNTGLCVAIITTRNLNLWTLRDTFQLSLGNFDREKGEALDLFKKFITDKKRFRAEKPQVEEIAELLGHLPLAIEIAASRLVYEPGWTAGEFLTRLRQNERLQELVFGNRSVRLSFSVSYDPLRADLKKFFAALGVFGGKDFTLEAVCHITQTGPEKAFDNMLELERLSLIHRTQDKRYRVHPLIQDFAREKIEGDKSYERMAEYYKNVIVQCADLYKKGGDAVQQAVSLFALEWENIRFGQKWSAENIDKNNLAANLCSEYALWGANLLRLRLPPKDRIQWLDVALRSARQSRNEQAEAKHLAEKGIAHYILDESETAISCYQEAIEIFRRVGDRQNEGNSLGNLGLVYANKSEFRKAIEFYEQHLVISRDLGNKQGESNALGNLANAYKNLNELSRALEFHDQSLKLAQELGDRRGEGTSYNDIGNVYLEQQEIEKAIYHYRKALAISRELHDRETEGDTLGNLGVAYHHLDNVRNAIKYYKQALIIDNELGDLHGKSATLNELGRAYADLGKADQGLELCNQALAIKKEIGDRIGEGDATWHKGYCMYFLGDIQQAIELAEQAEKIYLEQGIEDSTTREVREYIAKWKSELK
jgi:tetratricopeptide (TPR) repeat protein